MFTKSGRLLLLTVTLALISSCKNEPKDNDTRYFSEYLGKSLKSSIPSDSVNYVLISEFGCHGCIVGTINKLHDHSNVIFIVSKAAYYNFIEEQKLPASRYKIDSTGEVNRLKYHGGNAGIVQTANHSVYRIIPLQTTSLDSTLDVIFK